MGGPVPAVTCSGDKKRFVAAIGPAMVHYAKNAQPHLCHYDERCSIPPLHRGGSGCNAAGHDQNCRFCGFNSYPPCPEAYDCTQGEPNSWGWKQRNWCCKNFFIACFTDVKVYVPSGLVQGKSSNETLVEEQAWGNAEIFDLHALFGTVFCAATLGSLAILLSHKCLRRDQRMASIKQRELLRCGHERSHWQRRRLRYEEYVPWIHLPIDQEIQDQPARMWSSRRFCSRWRLRPQNVLPPQAVASCGRCIEIRKGHNRGFSNLLGNALWWGGATIKVHN